MSDTLTVAIAAPLAPELCDRIAAVDPRVRVLVDQALLPPMRHPADFAGEPSFSRTPEQQAAYEALVDAADVIYGITEPGGRLAETFARCRPRRRRGGGRSPRARRRTGGGP